jgi:hypothetical protein
MTPLPRIRRRRTEEEPADQSPAVDGPADAVTVGDAQTQVTTAPATPSSVASPPVTTPLRADHTLIAQAAAAVQASAEPAAGDDGSAVTDERPALSDDEPPPGDDEAATPSALRRFGSWVSGRSVAPEGAATEDEPAAEDEAAAAEAEPAAPAIAGAPTTPARGPSAKDRGRLRRRIRYLRRARELGLRDLGGLMFDQYRFRSPNQELLAAKLAALHALDSERRALEHILGDRRDFDDLREPGISACPKCGALHASDGRFCEVCGTRQIETAAAPQTPPET